MSLYIQVEFRVRYIVCKPVLIFYSRVSVSLCAGGSGSLKGDRKFLWGRSMTNTGDAFPLPVTRQEARHPNRACGSFYGSPELKEGNRGILIRRFESY